MKKRLRWITSLFQVWSNPFVIFYWVLLIALLYVLVGIYGMNWSHIPFS